MSLTKRTVVSAIVALAVTLLFAYEVHAQIVPAQNQVIISPYGSALVPGFVVSTSTSGTRKLEATTTPFFNSFFANTGSVKYASTTFATVLSKLFLPYLTSGELAYIGGTDQGVQSVATTTATCSGNTTCSAFTVLGSSPITISSTGGSGTGLSTSSPVSAGDVLYYSATGAGSATGVATTSTGTASNILALNSSQGTTIPYATTTELFAGISGGLIVNANNGTDIALLGAGNSANATFYGGVNIDGTTRLATSLSGLAQLTSGVISAITGTTGQFPYYSGTDAVTATSTLFVDTASEVGVGTTNPLTSLDVAAGTDTTNTIKDVLYLRHNTTATPTTNWGVGFGMYGDSATVDNREMFRLTSKWRVATDATRSTYVEAYGYNSGAITKMFQWGRASATFETLGSDSVTTVLGAGSSQNIINSNSTSGNVSKLTLFSENTLRAAWLGSQNNSLFLGTGNSAATVMTLASTTNVGIGITAPQSKLSISGGATIGASYSTFVSPTNGLLVEGNISIATTTPAHDLTVVDASAPQLSLGDSTAGNSLFTFRTIGNNFLIATTVPTSWATTTTSTVLSVAGTLGTSLNSNFTVNGSTTARSLNLTNALTVQNGGSGAITLTGLLVGNGTSAFTAIAGTTCTNQFLRAFTSSGGTCASINNGDWSGADLSVANGGTGLSTFGGTNTVLYTTAADTLASEAAFTYDPSPNRLTADFASTTAVSGTNETWSGISRVARAVVTGIAAAFTPAIEGEFGFDTTSNQVKYYSNAATRVLGNGNFYPSFSYATSTAWTGTTTIPLGPAFVGETWNQVMCFTDTGTVNVSYYDGTNRMNMLNASTTVGTFTFTTNNTFTAAEKRYVDIGTPASTPTKISCTISKSLTAD